MCCYCIIPGLKVRHVVRIVRVHVVASKYFWLCIYKYFSLVVPGVGGVWGCAGVGRGRGGAAQRPLARGRVRGEGRHVVWGRINFQNLVIYILHTDVGTRRLNIHWINCDVAHVGATMLCVLPGMLLTKRSNETSEDLREQPGLFSELCKQQGYSNLASVIFIWLPCGVMCHLLVLGWCGWRGLHRQYPGHSWTWTRGCS